MRKKAAIFTWCYSDGAANFGQVLQCYALQKMCEMYELEVKVIRYRKLRTYEQKSLIPEKGMLRDQYEYEFKDRYIEKQSSPLARQFHLFIKDYIHMSLLCYDIADILEEISNMDYLIIGSDQLWNPSSLDEVFLLNFFRNKQICFSYATGGIISDSGKYEKNMRFIASKIESFHAVSVREPISREILRKYTDKEIVDVLDPTLMLSINDWNEICGERLCSEKYLFCYFVGKVSPHKHIVKEILKSHPVEKVLYLTLNFTNEQVNEEDLFERMTDIGPKEFVSLIKYAEAVCTDSFHGFAFSVEFKKEFYLMDRAYVDRIWASNTRWDNIMDKFEIRKRYANAKHDLEELQEIDYEKVSENHELWKMHSRAYFERALEESKWNM